MAGLMDWNGWIDIRVDGVSGCSNDDLWSYM